MTAWWRRSGIWFGAGVLALLAYVPAGASSRGRMPADTKLYLYLDPNRLITDAPWTFDGRQFAGWVPHQVIAYLWPQGPWFSLGESAGLPDWITHRLWIGTILFAAGAGVLWAGRRLGLGVGAAFAAALVYQLAPYILPYVSRTSSLLLPWAGLGWIVGLTALAATRAKWRYAALCALGIATVGAVNATALLMVAPAPILWLVVAALERRVGWGRTVTTALRIGVLSIGVSLWWIVAVITQGRRGAEVLAYSESLESVSFTSTSTEVWRGLGYWLTYVRDPYAATTTAARDHLLSGRLIAGGFVLLLLALVGIVLTRWHERRFAIALVVTGVVLGVGVHPFDDSSPLMTMLAGDGESGLALALRSSTRAVPLLMLGLALGAGALVDALGQFRLVRRLTLRPFAVVGVALLTIANLPVLTGHRLVDPALDRQQDVPQAWLDAAAALDAAPVGFRVLQLPGLEFGAFRWGYTVDPPLPGLTEKPLVTRDLLPLGSPGAMDLLYAFDDRIQSGAADPTSVAPIARLLGVDTIWLTGDAAYERFRVPRPDVLHDFFQSVPGLGPAESYGRSSINRPQVPLVDEQSVSIEADERIPPVELIPVLDPVGIIRVKDREVLVAGSGDGLVDAAAAGLIDGTELIRYTASLDATELASTVEDATAVVITDANRQRAHHWRSSQDVVGFTEDGDPRTSDLLRRNVADQRLSLFDDMAAEAAGSAAATVAIQDGPVRARASSYGEPFAYRPEDRAYRAIDGNPATAWVVGDRADPVGEQLVLDVDEPVDDMTLRQPVGADAVRHIGAVTIDIDGRSVATVTLDKRSFQSGGQPVELSPTDGPRVISITIDSVVVPDPTLGPALAAVGFAEVELGLGRTVEVVRVPTDVVEALADAGETTPLSYVFTRLRTRPSDRWRSDPETMMIRQFDVPDTRRFAPAVTVRLDQRASDDVLADLLGIAGPTASSRLTGVTGAAGWAVADGDPATSWITPFSAAVGARLTVPLSGPTSELTIAQPDGDFSAITSVRLTSGDDTVNLDVTAPGPDGRSTVTLPDPLTGPDLELAITAVDARTVLDRRYGEPVELPAAIAELATPSGVTPTIAPTLVPTDVDTGCRDDLATVDGRPIRVRVVAPVAELLAGEPVEAEPCEAEAEVEVEVDAGAHLLTAGDLAGLHVDRVALVESATTVPTAPDEPRIEILSQDRLTRTGRIRDCPTGCWLVLGEGFNEAWSATADGLDLGPPQLVDGGFNGWWIEPTAVMAAGGAVDVAMRWTAQTPQTIALLVTAGFVLACIALIVADRRSTAPVFAQPARFAFHERPVGPRTRWVASGVWVVAAALLVGIGWAMIAALCARVLIVYLGRPRLAGLVTIGLLAIIGVVVVRVVQRERPFPDAGWPAEFEWLHGVGLFAAVTLIVAAFAGSRSGRQVALSTSAPEPVDAAPDGAGGEDGEQR
ncbi:MAG: alpha-(1-_3)-arabinofuranosyltransferase domain-containing protein [Ilumatobacteraceae bacterium]